MTIGSLSDLHYEVKYDKFGIMERPTEYEFIRDSLKREPQNGQYSYSLLWDEMSREEQYEYKRHCNLIDLYNAIHRFEYNEKHFAYLKE